MKEIIGKTRHGHEVWIDLFVNDNGGLEVVVAAFDSSDDNYDVSCVIEAFTQRLQNTAHIQRTERTRLVVKCLTEFIEGPKPSEFNSEAVALGHRTAPHRLRHGMRLHHPAYRW